METPIGAADTYAASITTSTENCVGSISLRGLAAATQRIEFRREEVVEQDECVITVGFDRTFKQLKMNEGVGCSFYHGASCAFDGSLKRSLTARAAIIAPR